MDTIIIKYDREGTSYAVISTVLSGLVIGYGNHCPGSKTIETKIRDHVDYQDFPEFKGVHDGYGWDMGILAAMMERIGLR